MIINVAIKINKYKLVNKNKLIKIDNRIKKFVTLFTMYIH
jgi:hypothetical protein